MQIDLGHAGDGRQGLAAKAERVHREQIVGRGQLAGGVIGEGEAHVVGQDAAAVIDDADQVGPALVDVDVDAPAAGIDAVFQQFLDDAGRPFDDLSGGDLRDDRTR